MYIIRHFNICGNQSEQIGYTEGFCSEKDSLQWGNTGGQRHLLERKHFTWHQEKQTRQNNLFSTTTPACQCLHIAGRYQPCHRSCATDVRRSQRNGIWFWNGGREPSYRRCLYHSQPMRQSAGILSGRFERAASYISAPPLPHTTTAEAVQHLTT